MPILAACPSCGKSGNVPDHAAGRSVKCPGCQTRFNVPTPAAPPPPPADPFAFDDAPPPPARAAAASRPPAPARPAPAPEPEPLPADEDDAPAGPEPLPDDEDAADEADSPLLALPRVMVRAKALSFGKFKKLVVTDPANGDEEVGRGGSEKSVWAGWFDNLKLYATCPYVYRDAAGAVALTVTIREPSLLARLPVAVPATRFDVLDARGKKVGGFEFKPVVGWVLLKSALYMEDARGKRVGEMVWVVGGGAAVPYLELRATDGGPVGRLVDRQWAEMAAEVAADRAEGKKPGVKFKWNAFGAGDADGLLVEAAPGRAGDPWAHRMLLALAVVVECYGIGKRQAGRAGSPTGGGHRTRRR